MTTKMKDAPPAVTATIAAENPTPAPQEFALIGLDKIRFSSTNPRKNFDPAKMAELVESVRSHGVLQPILVRRPYKLEIQEPAEGSNVWYVGCLNLIGKFNQLHTCYSREEAERKLISEERFELVAGERRYRAAKEAGLSEIPATVRTLTDKETIEIQFIENLLRDDLHPLEEAEGYQRLIKEHGYTVADLALKVGKSEGYVRARMKLAGLPKIARKALLEEKITPTMALLIARIPNPQLAEKAANEILSPKGTLSIRRRGDEITHTDIKEHIERNYMLRLDQAPFKTADPDLLPEVGPCNTCPKRTGNQGALFSDIKSADICTDRACYEKKGELAWKQVSQEAREKGQKIIDGAEAKKLFPWSHIDHLEYGSPYIFLNESCDIDPKQRTWQKLLGNHTPAPILARNPHNGKVLRLLSKDAANKALKEAGHDFKINRSGFVKSEADVAKEKAEREKALIQSTTIHTAVAQIVTKIEAADPNDLPFWKLLAKAMIAYTWHDTAKSVVHRRGLAKKKERPEDLLSKQVEGLSIPQIKALIYELSVCRDAKGQFNERYGKRFKEACALFGISPEGIEQKIRSERKEAKTQKKPPQTREKKKK